MHTEICIVYAAFNYNTTKRNPKLIEFMRVTLTIHRKAMKRNYTYKTKI